MIDINDEIEIDPSDCWGASDPRNGITETNSMEEREMARSINWDKALAEFVACPDEEEVTILETNGNLTYVEWPDGSRTWEPLWNVRK